MAKTAAVAISGGIDSLFAAYELIRAGFDVQGVHFITGHENLTEIPDTMNSEVDHRIIHHCECPPSISEAMGFVARQLDIKIHIIDCSSVFKASVIDYFVSAYQKGETPNPCLVCNPAVKFGVLMDFADSLNADFLATGHYVQTGVDDSGNYHLYKGKDPGKDQSYFLSFLSQSQLKKAKFPLGDKIKTEIIESAAKAGLSSVSSGESQDICFITNNDYKHFLNLQPDFSSEPGSIITSDGKNIGKHSGLHSFTIGQRRGINCPGPYPYYVLKLDVKTNSLVVGAKEALLSTRCSVKNINWINKPAGSEINVTTRIRYAHKGAESTVYLKENNTAEIIFHEPVSAVTPGQGAIFFSDSEVLGGGWIE